jgi:phage terminase large subunit-like protein
VVSRRNATRFGKIERDLERRLARRAKHRRAGRASGTDAFAVNPAQLAALTAQPWWRDEYLEFAASLDLLARLVIDNDGRRWGDVAHAVQWEDALAVLNPKSETRYHFLTRARGWSKTTDLAAIVLVIMLTQSHPGDRLDVVAADRDQGALLIGAINKFVVRTPGLAAVVNVNRYRVTAPGDVILEALPADPAGSYGRQPAVLIVDELAQWPDTPSAKERWLANYTGMHKVPDARLVVLTTAGDPAHFSHPIWERAKDSPMWHRHDITGPSPWADPAYLAEQHATLTDASWRRFYLNEWTAGDNRFTTLEDVRACVRATGPLQPLPGLKYVIGVDLGWKRDRTAVAVGHLEPTDTPGTPTVVIDRLDVWAGSGDNPVILDDVEAHILAVAHQFNRVTIKMDAREGVGMAQRLRAKGLTVIDEAFTTALNSQLASTLEPLLRAHRLDLPDDPDLVDELINLRIVEPASGHARIEHTPGRHNDRAIAIALAAHQLLTTKPRGRAELIA